MTIEAVFHEGETKVYTRSITQYDKGMKLKIVGLELPENFEVHFSNQPEGGVASAVTGKDDTVNIPDGFLVSGNYIYAWLCYFTKADAEGYQVNNGAVVWQPSEWDRLDANKVTTVCQIVIPVVKRPVPVIIQNDTDSDDGSSDIDPLVYTIVGESMVISERT